MVPVLLLMAVTLGKPSVLSDLSFPIQKMGPLPKAISKTHPFYKHLCLDWTFREHPLHKRQVELRLPALTRPLHVGLRLQNQALWVQRWALPLLAVCTPGTSNFNSLSLSFFLSKMGTREFNSLAVQWSGL